MLLQSALETLAGTEGVDFLHGIPRYPMLFQGAPETLAGTEGVEFYMVFHVIPCYSKALQRPLLAPRECIFIWCPTIFHAITKCSRDPCGHRLCRCLFHIPLYSIIFQAIPFPLRRGILGPCPGGLLEGFWSEVAL